MAADARRVLPAVLLAAAALAACGPTHAQPPGHAGSMPATASPSPTALAAVHDPGQVTGTVTGPCHARDDGKLPDEHCTPGAVDPAVDQANIAATICKAGYTATVRPPSSQTSRFKLGDAYPAYGLTVGTVSELDHLVPLELGGSNDAANLWPEVGAVPNGKDSVENALHQAVCDGKVPLVAAQIAIAFNWEQAEQQLGVK
jgi:hypothetical protein